MVRPPKPWPKSAGPRHRNKRGPDNHNQPCFECGKVTSWMSDNCVWMCRRRKNGIICRVYYHLECFNTVAGEDIAESIIR